MELSRKLSMCVALLSIAFAARAAEVKFDSAWVRTPAPGQKTASAYVELTSASDAALVSVASPLAERVELHTMSLDGGVMRMRSLPASSCPPARP